MDHVSQLKREKTGMLATSSPFWLETSDENFTTIINSVDIVRHNFSHIHTKHREKTLELINKIRSVDPNKRMLWDLQ